MAEDCTLYITNLTNEPLVKKSSPAPYQMASWNFPDIDALQTVGVSVEFKNQSSDEDDGAEQKYAFSSTSNNSVIDVYATSDSNSVHWLSVRSLGGNAPAYCVVAICPDASIANATQGDLHWYTISGTTTSAPQSHTAPPYQIGSIPTNGMEMGFAIVDLTVMFPASEAQTYFNAIGDDNLDHSQYSALFGGLKTAMAFAGENATWMTSNWDTLSGLALSSVCMPATHDSGMGEITDSSPHSNACNTQTQAGLIMYQLQQGARYFDFRPCLWQNWSSNINGWYLCHYADAQPVGVYGSAGQPLHGALHDVANFLAQTQGRNELVILKFSHFGWLFSNSQKDWEYGPLTDSNYGTIVSAVTSILGNYLFTSTNTAINLNQQTMQTLCGSGNRVLAVFDLAMFPTDRLDTASGIFGYLDAGSTAPSGTVANFVVFDQYAKSDNADTMINDQKQKFETYKPAAGSSFLLSWTLTMSPGDQVSGSPCISDLANSVNFQLPTYIDTWIEQGVITTTKKPNFLYLDYFGSDSDDATAVAMQLNTYQKSPA